MDTTTDTRTVADELRHLADLLDQADVPPPTYAHLFMTWRTYEQPQAVAEVAAMARAFGPVTKDVDAVEFKLRRDGPVKVLLKWPRASVCEEQTITKTETVTEWVCPDSVLALAAAAEVDA